MEQKIIERSILIDVPRGQAWLALTQPEQLAQWFLPPMLGAGMKRDAQDQLFVSMGGMDIPLAVFEVLDAPRQITLHSLPDRLITMTYTLDEAVAGTRVTMSLSGFESLPANAQQEREGPSGAGLEKALENLKAYLTGVELPFPEGYIAAVFGYRRETKQSFAVERSIWFAAPRERVWRAITDPQQIPQWFSPGTTWRVSALEVGGRLSVYDAETDTDKYTQVIEVFDPPQRFVTRMLPKPPEMISDTTTYALVEESGGTRLILTHSGYALNTDALRHQSMEQNAFGFGMMLENLRAYVEGQSLPYPFGF